MSVISGGVLNIVTLEGIQLLQEDGFIVILHGGKEAIIQKEKALA